ncbi:MAG TPA: hypothetical protein VLH15_05545 [Dehalococcoidales bacterium]|nr:hypothetical protein [Dehalococcoidales bacterium]
MNRIDLKNILDKEGISPQSYSLDGPQGVDSAYVLEERFGTWFVYFFEKGKKGNEQIFGNEDEACQYYLDKILRDPDSK